MGVVGRLLMLLAVLILPFGMAPAASAALSGDQHSASGMSHCPDQPGKHQHDQGLASCSMACASALPAQDLPRDDVLVKRERVRFAFVRYSLNGIQPEIATPPPKAA